MIDITIWKNYPDQRKITESIVNNVDLFLYCFSVNVIDLDLTLEKTSRPDLIFINKHGPIIYDALYTSLQMDSNTPENIEAVYTTIALLCVELASTETVIDLLQLILG